MSLRFHPDLQRCRRRTIFFAISALLAISACLAAHGANAQAERLYPQIGNALSTTVITVKPGSGALSLLQCYNPNSSQIYVQLFNLLKAAVTLGTTVPLLSIPIAATSTGGFALSPAGIIFTGAISAAATTTATGSSAPLTAPDCNFGFY